LALMVVWGYPCESKSSPAHYSKHPGLERNRGVAYCAEEICTVVLFQRYNEEAFYFGMIS
ncbi:hypothetical protein ABFY81_17315, partial [Acinetobacter sp. WA-87]|uniref:hypothetical protein n=1 Tax=Acinetobacter sp. WA-87 TaxID=3153556 RepID=UPI0032631780